MPALFSPPGVALDSQGSLEVFVWADDNNLWQIQQTPGDIQVWTPWQNLGAGGLAGPLGIFAPVAIPTISPEYGYGPVNVFSVDADHALWQLSGTGPGPAGAGWGPWNPLGGQVQPPIAVGSNILGPLEVFALNLDRSLWHIWQTLVADGPGPWAAWAPLGGNWSSPPAVGLNSENGPWSVCLQAFVIGTGFPTQMTSFYQPLGGQSAGPYNQQGLNGFETGVPSVGRNQDGRLEVFDTGQDVFGNSNVSHNWQTAAATQNWFGFQPLGNPPPGTINPQVTSNQDGRLEVFGMGADNALWHIWQTAPNNGWSGWDSRGVPGPGPAQFANTLGVGNNQDGRIEIFVTGSDGNLYHIWQTAPNNGWSGWEPLGHP